MFLSYADGSLKGSVFKGLTWVQGWSPLKIFLSVPAAGLTEPALRVVTDNADGGQEATKGKAVVLRGRYTASRVSIKVYRSENNSKQANKKNKKQYY